ncbi:dTDP-4-dehydrorhamnose 3,5-epimerase [Bradyrhizobium sp. U87765 SZCCT0131]|uniref:dTDP-4-dehydrorhamnose 3,5-epimerase n=1 Tax=unclassified Bradyrhizobium TaxID=2631580 RepID=UPI001BAC5DFA|nr:MULTISPECIES: dTDP-4-dehydrorhamnose 3,5-epimerase [unclassified Bradyrhizobium]MBR1219675.1 dTDP-4-dehydrorhamnose 3,5-epimerase [Bradyrhizobium sp. U87765 SZCCT0131]MBR1262326.1 dTDP-4-dehydrorhamnose 3,5-epimerase [Bradyrhizobium sp. U87765 SZCCT0134]MBR1308491.1 dTDP-4-dehydrorhamnose 3,5-epimerase [Bradyrhizobium sp. U87765 SZCCT0110]MBR1318108.1 dTDP-4-dehydrorhamnose 3,5-epimerase [Bradyrhizobium sp. U87765 SZCCT0109]MBR1351811.1 dTDP-4-dehydrorhamnose 3,5-epimerase [Bradyrhizobium s
MKATRLAIPDVVLLEPTVFEDERGCFFESFSQREFERLIGTDATFVQDNHSVSRKDVLRGLHYQVAPHAQGKLVRVVRGAIFDVAVDIREHSPTFRRWVGHRLSAENREQIWIPPGFAHGFVALEDVSEVVYKTTDYYDRASERVIPWSDPTIGVAWPVSTPILSPKDAAT